MSLIGAGLALSGALVPAAFVIGGASIILVGAPAADLLIATIFDEMRARGIMTFGDGFQEFTSKYEYISGTDAADTITLTASRQMIAEVTGLDGDDTITGSGIRDYIYGNGGADVIEGGDGGDYLYGRGMPAHQTGNSNEADADVIRGGAGDDFIYGEEADSGTIGGNDQLYGEDGNDQIFGGGGDDYIDGGTGNDFMYGGLGSDRFISAEGDDVIDGDATYPGQLTGDYASDEDVVSYLALAAGIVLHGVLGNGSPTIVRPTFRVDAGSHGDDWLTGIDRIETTNQADLLLLSGSPTGVPRMEIIDAGSPDVDDVFSLAGLTEGATVGWSGGIALGELVAYGFEIVVGSDHNDVIDLTGAADGFVLEGGMGADVLRGGAGDDLLRGGGGPDTIDGGEGDDVASYDLLASRIVASVHQSGATVSSDGTGNSDTLRSVEILRGSDHEDEFTVASSNGQLGWESVRSIEGGKGDDRFVADISQGSQPVVLLGGEGDDVFEITGGLPRWSLDASHRQPIIISGGAGQDVFSLKGSMAVVFVQASEAAEMVEIDFVDLATGAVLPVGATAIDGTAGDDSLVGTGADEIITGRAGADFLWSAGGTDTLDGGTGDDFLRAGSGADTIVFRSGDGADVVELFDLAADRIDLLDVDEADLTFWEDTTGTLISAPDGTSLWLIGITGVQPGGFAFV